MPTHRLSILVWFAPAIALAQPVDWLSAGEPIFDFEPVSISREAVDVGLDTRPPALDGVTAIRRSLRDRGPAIQRCLGRDLPGIQVVHPPVPIQLSIAADGAVEATVWTGNGGTERCISDALAARRFAPRPGAETVEWTGRVDFGFAPRRILQLPGFEIEIDRGTLITDARTADGSTGRHPTPTRPMLDWTAPPGWTDIALYADSDLPDPRDCEETIAADVMTGGARATVRWRAGRPTQVEVVTDLGPAFAGCLRAEIERRQRGSLPESAITTGTVRYWRVTDPGPRVLPGRVYSCCDGGWSDLRARLTRQMPALKACFRARAVAQPGLRGALTLGLEARDRSAFFPESSQRGHRIETRVAVLANGAGDRPLAECVAAAVEAIEVQAHELRHAPRIGLRAEVSVSFGVAADPPGTRGPRPPPVDALASWITVRGVDADPTGIIAHARAQGVSDDAEVLGARAAAQVGRLDLARALYTRAREAALRADDPVGALDAQIELVDLLTRADRTPRP